MACNVTHVLRHTVSVTAIQKGISLPALQRLLGHDRLTTTEIDLNLSPEEVLREFRAKGCGRYALPAHGHGQGCLHDRWDCPGVGILLATAA